MMLKRSLVTARMNFIISSSPVWKFAAGRGRYGVRWRSARSGRRRMIASSCGQFLIENRKLVGFHAAGAEQFMGSADVAVGNTPATSRDDASGHSSSKAACSCRSTSEMPAVRIGEVADLRDAVLIGFQADVHRDRSEEHTSE